MSRRGITLVVLLVTGLAAWAGADDGPGGDALRQAPTILRPAEHGVGRRIPDLALRDLDGAQGHLSDHADRKVVVLAFTNVGCPVCRKYAPRLARLAETHAKGDALVLLVNASPQDTPDAMREAVESQGFTCPYIVDHDRAIARALGATTTAEVFVLDRARTLVYRGALDDQYGVGFTRAAPKARYVEDAIVATLAGRRPEVQATTAPGCVLDLAEPTENADGPVTWHEHVSRIVQDRCVACHRDGQAGPFPLGKYADVKGNAGMVRWAVEHRRMPPWFAGEQSLAMSNDPSLTERERRRMLAWIDAGCPEGDPEAAPVPRTFPDDWALGEPDAVIDVPRTIEVPAEGFMDYIHIKVPTDFGEDKWIRGYQVRPSAPEVVHHVLVFVHYPKDHPKASEQPRVRGGLGGYMAALVPGRGGHAHPAGTAKRLPKGATLEFQLHYTPNGKATRDRTQLALYFTDEPEHRLRTLGVHNTRFRIPAGHADHPVTSTKSIPTKARIHAFLPHMHLRGKAFRYEAIFPDGTVRTLLDVPKYDFNWQLTYELRKPLDVPAGTRIRATARYDNSADNPANPDPTRDVGHGLQTFDEMMIGYVDWHPIK